MGRLFRALRAWFGKLVGSIEDPAAILEQNLRDMNDQVPKMNENIAMVKANVTMLERELAKITKEDETLVSKMKAAIGQSRDDLAANYAVQLEQVRESKMRVTGELQTAKAAFGKAQEVKKAFLAEKERKTKEAMIAIKQARQAEWQAKVADAMEQFSVGGIDQTHDEMIQRINEKSAVNEAKMDMAMDNVNVDEMKMEQEAAKLRGMDLVNQMKMEMGVLDSSSESQGQSQGQKENA